jgi:hypothetical protein
LRGVHAEPALRALRRWRIAAAANFASAAKKILYKAPLRVIPDATDLDDIPARPKVEALAPQ